jgi:hypothetical protein
MLRKVVQVLAVTAVVAAASAVRADSLDTVVVTGDKIKDPSCYNVGSGGGCGGGVGSGSGGGDGETGRVEGDGGGQQRVARETRESLYKKAVKAMETWKKPCVVRGENPTIYTGRAIRSCVSHVADQLPWTILVNKDRVALDACNSHLADLAVTASVQADEDICGG